MSQDFDAITTTAGARVEYEGAFATCGHGLEFLHFESVIGVAVRSKNGV